MRFVLTYAGSLPANGNPRDKHRIRQALLPQLKQQWEIEPALKSLSIPDLDGKVALDSIKKQFTRMGFNFVPLVLRQFKLVCYLEITMLRREEPGNVLQTGGDIDNRLKTLFDSLTIPVKDNQLTGITPQPNEDPFYCLLEDDSLVTGMEIKTERLLENLTNPTDVRLTIAATVRPTKVEIGNLGFLGGWL